MKTRVLLLFSVVCSITGFAQKADDLLGKWMSDGGKAKFEIFKSGDKYYGKIVWLKNPLDENGNPKTDKNNPDPARQNQKVLGLLLLKSFSFDGKEWTNGTIYDPEKGKEYSCKISMNTNGSLNIRGYIGVSLIGRTTVWTKAEQ